jgi:hypothetical protein
VTTDRWLLTWALGSVALGGGLVVFVARRTRRRGVERDESA